MHDQLTLEGLLETGRRVLTDVAKIQDTTGLGDEFPIAERSALADQLSEQYHSWYSKAQAALPEGDQTEFRKLYEGGFFSPSIKKFFSDPLKLNPFTTEKSADFFGRWLHDFATAFRGPMLHQLSILERRLHQRPAVLNVSDVEIRLPRFVRGHQSSIESFLAKNPYDKNVFLMMKYRDGNRHIAEIIRAAVANAQLKLWLASDVQITDELGSNVVACLLACKFGIALFDEPEDNQHINPNVAYELGMMHLLDRPCLILKSKDVVIQSDILAKLYSPYDGAKPGEIIGLTHKWLVSVGATTA